MGISPSSQMKDRNTKEKMLVKHLKTAQEECVFVCALIVSFFPLTKQILPKNKKEGVIMRGNLWHTGCHQPFHR